MTLNIWSSFLFLLSVGITGVHPRQALFQLRHILQLSSAHLLSSCLRPCLMSMLLPLNPYCLRPVPHLIYPPAHTGLYFSTLASTSSPNLLLAGWNWVKPALKFPHSHSRRCPGCSAGAWLETVPICSAHSICPEHSSSYPALASCVSVLGAESCSLCLWQKRMNKRSHDVSHPPV